MLSVLNLFAWCGLAGLSLHFLHIGIRLRPDRSYADFSAALLLLLAGTFPAAWLGAVPGGPVDGVSAAAVLSGFISMLALQSTFLAFLSKASRPVPILPSRILAAWNIAAGTLLGWELLTGTTRFLGRGPAGGLGFPSPLGAALLLPPLAGFLILAARAIYDWHASAHGSERLRARLALAACAALAAGSLADAGAYLFGYPGGYLLIGWALLASAFAGVLLSRCLEIERENRIALERLASAYTLLRENAGLRELGASAAMISHEIRNYVSTLKGNAVLIERGGMGGCGQVVALREATERLEVMTRDIAAFSTLGRFAPPPPRAVRLDELIQDCIARNFPDRAGSFVVAPPGCPTLVQGDPAGLDQVFNNLFRNALEAGATRVDVRFLAFGDRLIAAVEDDGTGCPAEDLPRIGTPFFTGKGDRGGTGLGCSVAASILHTHGATLRAYSKNVTGPGRSGLLVNVVFPQQNRIRRESGGIVIAAEAAPVRACMLPPLLNLGMRPILLSGALLDARIPDGSRGLLLLVEEASASRILPAWGAGLAFIADDRRVMWRVSADGGPLRLLSEEGLAGILSHGVET